MEGKYYVLKFLGNKCKSYECVFIKYYIEIDVCVCRYREGLVL